MSGSTSHGRGDSRPDGAGSRANTPTYVLDRASVRAVDREAIETYGIPGMILMENAARAAAMVATTMVDAPDTGSSRIVIACGAGNNGGDGYAMARHLHNMGYRTLLVAMRAPADGGDAAMNAAICRAMKLPIVDAAERPELAEDDLVVDALFGTGLDRPLEGEAAEIVDWINTSVAGVLAVDVPSGLDCNTGRPLGPCVRATTTVTFVGTKPGFLNLDAQPFVGDVVVAGIGAPAELTHRFGCRLETTGADDGGDPRPPSPPPR